MPAELYFYNAGWKRGVEAWTYVGGTWRQVNAIWVYSVGQTSTPTWRKVFTNASHDSTAVYDDMCSPTMGHYSATWSGTNLSGLYAKVEYDVGGGWIVAASGIDATLGTYSGDLSGASGFTSLNSTNFRVTLYDAYDNSTITNSPQTASPPYPC